MCAWCLGHVRSDGLLRVGEVIMDARPGAGSPADAAANAPAENMGAECMQAAILMVNRSPRHPRSAEPTGPRQPRLKRVGR